MLGINLDEYGIVVCNINSTNFKPYVKLLRELCIPFVVITDGDFYYLNDDDSREYHILHDDADKRIIGYLGNEIIAKLFIDLGLFTEDELKGIKWVYKKNIRVYNEVR